MLCYVILSRASEMRGRCRPSTHWLVRVLALPTHICQHKKHMLGSFRSRVYNWLSSAVGTTYLCVFGARMASASRSAQELRKPFPAWYGEQRTSTQQLWCAYHADGQGAWLGRRGMPYKKLVSFRPQAYPEVGWPSLIAHARLAYARTLKRNDRYPRRARGLH